MVLPLLPSPRGSQRPRPGVIARSAFGLLGVLVVMAVGGVACPSTAFGQTADTVLRPVPEPALVAKVTPDPLDPPQIQTEGVWIAPGEVGPQSRMVTVNVAFATRFEIPREPWRVSVSVGDPLGERVRASLVSVGSAGVSGRVERGDGVQWDDGGPAEVTANGGGVVTIGVPVDGVGDAAVLWVEAEATVDRVIEGSRTPTFPFVDLLGDRPGPSVGTSSFAVVVDEPDASPLLVAVPGPTVQVVGRALEVTTAVAVPTEIDGVRVVDVIDTVTLVEVQPEATTSRLEIDRRTGEVRLATAGAEPFVAVPGTTPWLLNPPSPTAPGAPATLTFDLEALNEAIGGPALDRATTRVGVSRVLALDDRRILDAAGVGGTMAWFDDSLTAPAAADPPPSEEDGVSALVLLAAGAVVLAAVVGVVFLLLARRRANEPRPIDRLDPAPAPVAAGVPSLASLPGRPRPVAAGVPSLASLPGRPRPVAAGVPSLAHLPGPPSPVAAGVPSLAHLPEPPSPVPPDAGPEAVARDDGPEAPDPLAAFLADVDELSARVDRLGASETGAVEGEARPEPVSDAQRGSGPDRPR